MNEEKRSAFQVIDARNVRGTIDLSVPSPAREEGGNSRLIFVRFDDGSHVFADAASFIEREPGVFYFPGSFRELFAGNSSTVAGGEPGAPVKTEQMVIPVMTEELKVERQRIVTGGVRVHKTIEERTESVSQPVLQEQINVERIAVNQFITEEPPVRYEGDTMIVPLLEEVLVVEKRLILREEIRITKSRETVQRDQKVVLRSEQATLERIAPEGDKTGNAPVNQTSIREF